MLLDGTYCWEIQTMVKVKGSFAILRLVRVGFSNLSKDLKNIGNESY